MRYLLWLKYDGTDFHGWQRQKGDRTVQGELEQALTAMLGRDYSIASSSRTDSGVHALRHPVSLRTGACVPALGLLKGLNSHCPEDMAVSEIWRAPETFRPAKMATGKTYRYRLLESIVPDPFEERYSWRRRGPIDLPAMVAGAEHLVGHHDFSAFQAADCDARSPLRLVTSIRLERKGAMIIMTLTGNAFLRNMVRIIAGSLVQVGLRREKPEWIREILASRDRTLAGQTAPPQGLFLVDVNYPAELFCHGAHHF